MMVTMLIALYTSRVILQKLGVEDYGIYNAVGGIVGFLSFLNAAISAGTSRFLTYELGTGNYDKLRRTFSTVLTAHIIIAIIVVLLAETIGIWFLYHRMVVPANRMTAAVVTYHLSIITAIVVLTQVPYNASIIAHEKMVVYAYTSIIDVILKLALCYLLGVVKGDRLVLYSILMFVEHVGIMLFYRFYCTRKFSETKYKFLIDKSILKPILSFSVWSLLSNGTLALNNQGILILLNMFFSPVVVSARAISIQVNNATNQLVTSFRTAANPQIVKLDAVGDYEGSHRLLLQSTKYSYYLMLILTVPIFFLADSLLHFWLGVNVPEFTTIFLQLVLIQSLFQVFDFSFYTALYTKGQIKENALISPIIMFLVFLVVYYLFKSGSSPVAMSWASLIASMLLALIVKPILIVKIADYKWKEILEVFIRCFIVTIIASIPSFFVSKHIENSGIGGFFLELIILIIIVLIAAFSLGLNKSERKKICAYLVDKIIK